jgi:hypothetical protein
MRRRRVRRRNGMVVLHFSSRENTEFPQGFQGLQNCFSLPHSANI